MYGKMRELLTFSASVAESVNFGRLGIGFLLAYLFIIIQKRL